MQIQTKNHVKVFHNFDSFNIDEIKRALFMKIVVMQQMENESSWAILYTI